MPIMDGFTSTEEIKKLESKGLIPKIPIIAISANDRP